MKMTLKGPVTDGEKFRFFVLLLVLLNIMPWAVECLSVPQRLFGMKPAPFNLKNAGMYSFLILVFTFFYIFIGKEKLKEIDNRWQVLTNTLMAVPEPVFCENLMGKITFINELCCRLTGWDANEVIGRMKCRDVLGEGVEYIIRQSMERREIIDGAETEVIERKGKKAVPVKVTAGFIRGPSGRAMGGIAIVKDITREREIQDKLQKAENLVGAGQLASSIANELSEPLNIMKILTHNLISLINANSSLREPKLIESAGMLEKQVERTLKTMDYILTHIGHLEAEVETKVKADINRIVLDSIGLPEISDAGVIVNTELQDNLPLVSVHKGKMQRAILNIIRSRLKAMDEFSRGKDDFKKVITVKTFTDDKTVVVSFSDTGGDIPVEEMDSDKYTDIKLALELVRSFGGELSVGVKEGGGSKFLIELPLEFVS